MWFLSPLALFALGALVGPVLIHLIQRERKRVMPFPSLMFLRRIPYQSVRRRRIRHWTLLLLRLAALALIVVAFARPYWERPAGAAARSGGPRELVILLDQSYSMGYGDRWARAQAAARRTVEGLGPADRATLVLFAAGAEVAVQGTADAERLRAAIDGARPSAAATRFAPALKLAASLLAASRLPRRELVVISDFQRVGWSRDEAVHLPERVALTPVPIIDRDPVNASVTSVKLQRTSVDAAPRLAAAAIVTNHSDRPLVNLSVAFELDGRTVQTRRVNIDRLSSTAVDFDPAPVWTERPRGRIRLDSDPLDADNVFHFVLPRSPPVTVELVERPGASRDSSFYLRQALAIGEEPRFELRVVAAERALEEAGTSPAVAILNDVPLAGSPLAARLARFLARGGGALAVFGERATWPEASFEQITWRLGPPVDRPGRGGALAAIEYGHTLFELFRRQRGVDFGTARFFRYRRLETSEPTRVLARFDDGAPALVEAPLGTGRLLAWTSTLDSFWNDLALKPVFLPWLHQTMRYLARYVEAKPWVTVGAAVDPAAIEWRPGEPSGRRPVAAQAPSGRRLAPERGDGVFTVTEQGFYEVRVQGERDPLVVAVNVDPAESDLTPMDPAEFVGAVTGRAASATASGGAPTTAEPTPRERRELWWSLLLAGVTLLAAELVVANRLARSGPVG